MSVNLSPFGPKPQFEGSDGLPAVGNKLFFYVAGSVGTKQNTYTTSTGGVANSNPIILDALGNPTNTQIWFTSGQSYKVVFAPSTDTDPPTSPIWSVDNIVGINDTSTTLDEWTGSGLTPTYVSATQFTLAGDQTTEFHVGRRVKCTVTAGTSYATISVSAFAALTTITVVTTGSNPLDAGLSSVSLGVMRAVNTSWPQLAVAGSGITITWSNGKPTFTAGSVGAVPRKLSNIGLAVTMAANAATIALKGADGNDPSASNPVAIDFRSATLTSGVANSRSVTAALSTVISSGSTGGTVSAQPSRIWMAGIDNAGTVELAWFQSISGTTVAPINEGGVITTTAEGGAGAADSAQTWYSTTARTSVPVTVLGYFDSTQATAGTWASAAGVIAVNPEVRPGRLVQYQRNQTGAVATGSTVIPEDDTTPQITEGDQYMSQAITPTSGANVLEIDIQMEFASTAGAGSRGSVLLFQDATANALAAMGTNQGGGAGEMTHIALKHAMVANTTSATILRARAGFQTANTTTFNGATGGRFYGGVMASSINIKELSA